MMDDKGDILEIFSSVQGEGLYIGQRQIFIRFKGCNLDCAFCDTDKSQAAITCDIDEILERIDSLNISNIHNSVAITGGEPLLYSKFLKRLLPKVKERGLKIFFETNATLTKNLSDVIEYLDTISVDIKLPSVGGNKPCWQEHKSFLEVAFDKEFFIKVVVSSSIEIAEFDKAIELVKEMSFDIPFIIQPETKKACCELNISAVELLSLQERALKLLNNVLVIPQAHKMMGIR